MLTQTPLGATPQAAALHPRRQFRNFPRGSECAGYRTFDRLSAVVTDRRPPDDVTDRLEATGTRLVVGGTRAASEVRGSA
jgi:hypothetical protein